jgi:hypothetical protein
MFLRTNFPAGIFESKEKAEELLNYSLTGILSLYPIDMLLYDWAIEIFRFEYQAPNTLDNLVVHQLTISNDVCLT